MPDDRKLSTERLDDAMKELIDICQLYNDKISQQTNRTTSSTEHKQLPPPPPPLDFEMGSVRNDISINGHRDFPRLNKLFGNAGSKNQRNQQAPDVTHCDNVMETRQDIYKAQISVEEPHDHDRDSKASPLPFYDSSIDRLQQKQCQLQKQLDEVLEVAKSLDLRQKKKLNILIEDTKNTNGIDTEDEEDIELIEFRQIENELRISELNRQLNNIQEQLRLRLYRRLSSRTSNESFKSAREHRRTSTRTSNDKESLKRRDSAQTDESTPSTSSCSDEPGASSSISKSSIENDLAHQLEKCNLSSEVEAFALQQSQLRNGALQSDCVDSSSQRTRTTTTVTLLNELPSSIKTKNVEKVDLDIAFDQQHNYEVLVHTSRLQHPTSETPSKLHSHMGNNNIYTNIMVDKDNRVNPTNGLDLEQTRNYQNAFNGLRVCPTNSDLERIEEGEEDDNDYFCSSDEFRKVYETKISPIMHAAVTASSTDNNETSSSCIDHAPKAQTETPTSKPSDAHIGIRDDNLLVESDYPGPRIIKDRRFNPDNINSAKRGGSRPLTMYLPKPDEEIDLIETVQALGHDLDILSKDIQFTSLTARGYLYKSCSNNNKKWLKRYFYFDRQSKVLSYYENEEQLVKKTNSPRSMIPFDEIGDVYVDHRLNELNEKQKSSKRKSYVFVLATTRRKYLLASSKPEAMRAWIDVLFTAAKANDYFQQVGDNDEESLSFNYNSFTG